MVKSKGCRSSFDGKPWKCSCGFVNKPTKHRFFNLPAFQCRQCEKELTLDFSFCLGDIEVQGKSVVGEVRNQDKKPHCVGYAYAKAAEITERAISIKNRMDPDQVKPINPEELQMKFEKKYPGVPSVDSLSLNAGLHKVLHTGLILRSEGVMRDDSDKPYIAADVSTIPRDDFEQICQSIADGFPVVATYLTGKRKGDLPYCKIYKSPPLPRYTAKKAARKGHAVVLIGAGMKNGRRFFYFMNSWGTRFCRRKNKKGDTIRSGVGKLRMEDLTKNVVRLSGPDEAGGERSLQAQTMLNISRLNYILMTALKSQTNPERLRQMREDDNAGEIPAVVEDDGIFDDDEGGLQNGSAISQRGAGIGCSCFGPLRTLCLRKKLQKKLQKKVADTSMTGRDMEAVVAAGSGH